MQCTFQRTNRVIKQNLLKMLNNQILVILVLIFTLVSKNAAFISNKVYFKTSSSYRRQTPSLSQVVCYQTKDTPAFDQGDATTIEKTNAPQKDLANILNTKYFFIVEGLLIFTTLSAIDGGFSGDWSKYGFISESTELFLKHTVVVFAIIRSILSGVTFQMLKKSNDSLVFPILRVLFVGEIAFLKFYLDRMEMKKIPTSKEKPT